MVKLRKSGKRAPAKPKSPKSSAHVEVAAEAEVSEIPCKRQKTQNMALINPNDPALVKLATCHRCNKRYNSSTRVPVTMVCGHSVCKACIPRCCRFGDLFMCTVCQGVHAFSSENWTKNVMLYKLLEKFKLINPRKPLRKKPNYINHVHRTLSVAKTETEAISKYLVYATKFFARLSGMSLAASQLLLSRVRRLKDAKKFVDVYTLHLTNTLKTFEAVTVGGDDDMEVDPEEHVSFELLPDEDPELDDLVSCGVCFEAYNKTNLAPISFPCGHTFCRRCVSCVVTESIFKCCMCRVDHFVDVTFPGADENAIVIFSKLDLLGKDEAKWRPPNHLHSKMDDFTKDTITTRATENINRCATTLLSLMLRLTNGTEFPGFNGAYVQLLDVAKVFNKLPDLSSFESPGSSSDGRRSRRRSNST
uniref:E3 ubiquitin-protein ligase RNF182 n=1 Tax=Panagrellus redivivus TaxID=6233 RepID=A0A7E4VKK8_PANRE